MRIGIGIDTGGTYTDAVAFDFEQNCIVAKGKARTTKEDLSLGICAALDFLPLELVRQAAFVALSTTLATNACVEGKGGRSKLVMLGTPDAVLRRIDAPGTYGLDLENVLCLDTHGSFDGSVVDEPDWNEVMTPNDAWFADAQALGIVEMNAPRNGAVVERHGKAALSARYGVPVVAASELACDLNMMERGATALLNAKLLPVIEEFLDAVARALSQRDITAPVMIVRSDGALMTEQFTRMSPVETMASGPAASVQGCRKLAACDNCVVVDMGGTTTDLSLVVGGRALATDGMRIGSWKTQVKGVFMETLGLGGDSAIRVRNGELVLDARRVEPLCAAVARWPQLASQLEELVQCHGRSNYALHEALYLVREPSDESAYTAQERHLLEELRRGPWLLGDASRLDVYAVHSERLEDEGVVMRCGLTPTDIMHVKGDFSAYDARASLLAVRCLGKALPSFSDTPEGIEALCDAVYSEVERKLYSNIVRVLLQQRFPRELGGEFPPAFAQLVDTQWHRAQAGEKGSLFDLSFDTRATLVGVGAPTHIFLPAVARALEADFVVPPDAGVANAVGAVTTCVSATASVQVAPRYNWEGVTGYTVQAQGCVRQCSSKGEALAFAREEALRLAREKALSRGALGALECTVDVRENSSATGYGDTLYMGATVVAEAREARGAADR